MLNTFCSNISHLQNSQKKNYKWKFIKKNENDMKNYKWRIKKEKKESCHNSCQQIVVRISLIFWKKYIIICIVAEPVRRQGNLLVLNKNVYSVCIYCLFMNMLVTFFLLNLIIFILS